MKKQITAVEWLEKELIKRFKRSKMHYTDSEWCFDMIIKLSNQAKEMEKEQIIDAFDKGLITENTYYGYDDKKGEKYYNETFKKE